MADKILTLDDLLKMSESERKQVMMNAYPFDADALENKMYRGIDLSLPPIIHKILFSSASASKG
jgi:hypothetical protein